MDSNWKKLLEEYEPLIGRTFIDNFDYSEWKLFGLVHGDDDYYFGLCEVDVPFDWILVSCVGHLNIRYILKEL